MTADCLPVLFCNQAGTEVVAAHAGWRGLCEGVLEETVACFHDDSANLIAWLGPAIGPQAFEVGARSARCLYGKKIRKRSKRLWLPEINIWPIFISLPASA